MSDDFTYGERIPNPNAGHLSGCELLPLIHHPVHGGRPDDPVYICVCAAGCSHVVAAIERGVALAAEYGWVTGAETPETKP